MADSLISALVKELVVKLTAAAIQEYGLLRKLKNDLSALNETFQKIKGVLNDAEEKQKTEKDVEEWLKTLKFASLEAENVLDEAKTKDMIQRLHRKMGKKYKRRAFFSSRYNPLLVRFRIAHKVKNIRNKLKVIDANRSEFKLLTSEDGAGIRSNRETSSGMPKIDIYGRDNDKKMIVDKICNHDDDGVRVYAIWGMGGIGKTTLAQLVYNDETVKFDLKCWVYVSAVFDVKRIIKATLESMQACGSEVSELESMQACLQKNNSTLDALQECLKKKLRGNKFFIVMDDVWIKEKDMADWEELYKGLSCGAKGSTVLVTTREKDIAERMVNNIPELQHNLLKLTEDESWSLFKMLAFPGGEQGGNERELEPIGRQIVEKCNGLPLAVKSLGNLMSKEKTVEKWQRVNKNFKSKIQENVLPALRLSYDDLPPHMKICFAYCCVFLKGKKMSKDTLIELWMANGFIPSQEDASLYELGEEIFDCLIGRSFFQDVVVEDIDTGVICKMHDSMHDLAQSVMKHDCAVLEPGKELKIGDEVHEVLHLSLSSQTFHSLVQDLEKLRSLRSISAFYDKRIFSLVYLRVLYLKGIKSSTLPESICKLIHLRYLKISGSEIEVIPESIMYLQNLQTLILKRCYSFRELPKGLRYMRSLQRLDTSSSPRHMPVGIKELTNLRRLSDFVVGKDAGAQIGELENLNLLGWELELSGLENVGGLNDAKRANLEDKTNLKSLRLNWTSDHNYETYDEEVLEGLEPNSGLRKLEIWYYMGRVISPSWLVNLVNLTSVVFGGLSKCEQLPPLGKLLKLKRIKLYDMRSLKCFHDDDNATSNDDLFPSLQHLYMYKCDELCYLPHNIQSFKNLNEITIYRCKILSIRCEKEIGEDWPKISNIPHLDIETPRFEFRSEDEDSDKSSDMEVM